MSRFWNVCAAALAAGVWLSGGLAAQSTTPAQTVAPPINEQHEEWKTQADVAYRQGNYTESLRLLELVLRENPQDDVALYLRASARVEQGAANKDAALIRSGINDARTALGIEFNVDYYLPYLYGMSRLAETEGRPEHASSGVAVADKILAMPEATPPQKANIHFQRSLLNLALGDRSAAIGDLRAAIGLQPKHLAAHTALCNLVLQSGDAKAAETQFNATVAAIPDQAIVFNNRGTFLQSQNRLDEAVRDFNRALELDPSYVPALTNRGYVYIMQGRFALAETDLTRSLELNPQQPVAFGLRGAARLHLGRPDAAIQDYQTAVTLNPTNAAAYYDLGFAQFCDRDYAAAGRSFDQAVKTDPSLTFLAPWRYTALVFSSQRDRALAEFGALERKPESERTWFDVLTLYLMGKLNEDAVMGAINKSDPKAQAMQECEANYFIGLRHASRNQPEQARKYFDQALATGQRHLSAYRAAMYAVGKYASQ
jgi:Tfp pilus assembly protein PilF